MEKQLHLVLERDREAVPYHVETGDTSAENVFAAIPAGVRVSRRLAFVLEGIPERSTLPARIHDAFREAHGLPRGSSVVVYRQDEPPPVSGWELSPKKRSRRKSQASP